jgi:23S rRNA U2552 (ribose-2'-O)-methylase RlmE/FtsJ
MGKLKAEGYDTDKGINNYLEKYEEYFHHLTESQICLLELGVKKGGSLLMWRDYFKQGTIVGLDINHVHLKDSTDRIHIFQGLQQDEKILDKIRNETATGGFDIIIDDASHIGELTSLSFWYLFDNHLKPNGVYVIEDWRTGYYRKWPDGKKYSFRKIEIDPLKGIRNLIDFLLNKTKNNANDGKSSVLFKKLLNAVRQRITKKRLKSHDYGMVGFIKQLIDELGIDINTHPDIGGQGPSRNCKFKKMEIVQGLVFITKKPDAGSQKIL